MSEKLPEVFRLSIYADPQVLIALLARPSPSSSGAGGDTEPTSEGAILAAAGVKRTTSPGADSSASGRTG
jgi:hypothetical protein